MIFSPTYLIIGALAGFLSGLLGIGGGIIIVPSLIFIFRANHFPVEYAMSMATATSLATIMFTTSAASVTHILKKKVQWKLVKAVLPGMLIGVQCGTRITSMLPSVLIQQIFGVFLLLVGLQFMISARSHFPNRHVTTSWYTFSGIGLLAGTLSGMLGISGGVVLIPLLVYLGVILQSAQAVSVTCTFPMVVVGALTSIYLGMNLPGLPPYTLGYIYYPAVLIMILPCIVCAPIGVFLAHRLPVLPLKRVFGLVLCGIAVDMLH